MVLVVAASGLTIRSSRPHVVASAMCFTLRLHTSAAPPRVGLTQALGAKSNMLELDRTANLVCHLLNEVPGLVVTSTHLGAAHVRFDLVDCNAYAIEALHRISLGANVAFEHTPAPALAA